MIPEYKTLLYATDLSPNAAQAFRHAVSLARRFQARVHILHVLPEVEPAVLNYVGTVMGEDQLANFELKHKDSIRTSLEERLKVFARDELSDHPEDLHRIEGTEVHHGSPVAVILQVADRLNVDLIILGSHGKGPLKYAFLGSVAEKVLRKSHRPVLVVPLSE